jgi:enoyl-CoA hydratase/carnithine racemase
VIFVMARHASVPAVTLGIDVQGNVAVVELQDPPHNFLSVAQVTELADTLQAFDDSADVRAVVLAAQGKSFCAGANFGGPRASDPARSGTGGTSEDLYAQAARLCEVATPVIAAVHGAAVGGGLGLAMTATFRVTCTEARFSANFVKLGIHQGFGLSVTLPELIGRSKAALVLLTGRRFKGDEAAELGMADVCVPQEQVRDKALELAHEIASGAPLAIRSIHRTLRDGLADRVREITKHEAAEQAALFATEDAREGVRAVSERREGRFVGR